MLQDDTKPETEECSTCKGTGKCTWVPGRETCTSCDGAGKLTQSQAQHAKWCNGLLDDLLKTKRS